jgi:hypothetical protein
MKTIRLSAAMLLVLVWAACTKSDYRGGIVTTILPGNVNSSQAADMISTSISLNSGGVLNIVGDIALNARAFVDTHLACGSAKTDSVTRTNTQGATTTYNYNAKYLYTLLCNSSNQPDTLTGVVSYATIVNSPRLSSNNSGSTNFIVSKLNVDSNAYSISGEYKTSGSFQSKVDTAYAGSNNVDIVLNNLSVTKYYRMISSGSAIFNLTGTVPKNGNFSYTGTIVFNNNNTANVTLNGTVYIVNLLTGQTTKQ